MSERKITIDIDELDAESIIVFRDEENIFIEIFDPETKEVLSNCILETEAFYPGRLQEVYEKLLLKFKTQFRGLKEA
jgi:hypothetical protein